MRRYLISRLIQLITVPLGAASIIFLLLHLSGDPAARMLPPEATQAEFAQLRHQMGWDRPIYVQYLSFLEHLAKGDMGESTRYRQPALQVALERLPATLYITGAAMLLSLVIGVPLGIASAVRRGSWLDALSTAAAVQGQSMPVFWLGLLLILLFSVRLGWLPSAGGPSLRQLILPTIALSAYPGARFARLTRSSLLEVLSLDFVRTARAKGLAERLVIYRHALRNSLIPVATVFSLNFSALLGGAVVTESVFSWPGIGTLMVQGVSFRDYNLVQSAILVIALLGAVFTVLTDLAYVYLDPRIKLTGGGAA